MRKHFGAKSWLLPQPVILIATYDEYGKADIMNAAWGGMYDSDLVMLCLDNAHKTTKNIKTTKAFTLSFADVKNTVAADYVGIVSANDEPEKLKKSGFHVEKSSLVNAPIITDLPFSLECEPVKFNEDGILIGKILNASADESVLDEKGSVDLGKLDLIIFDPINAEYRALGKKVGDAFVDGNQLM